jgi:hypothetical protein
MSLDTKHEMIAYVHGYILALSDILKDVEDFHDAGVSPVRVRIRQSLVEAQHTLEVLTS